MTQESALQLHKFSSTMHSIYLFTNTSQFQFQIHVQHRGQRKENLSLDSISIRFLEEISPFRLELLISVFVNISILTLMQIFEHREYCQFFNDFRNFEYKSKTLNMAKMFDFEFEMNRKRITYFFGFRRHLVQNNALSYYFSNRKS